MRTLKLTLVTMAVSSGVIIVKFIIYAVSLGRLGRNECSLEMLIVWPFVKNEEEMLLPWQRVCVFSMIPFLQTKSALSFTTSTCLLVSLFRVSIC